MEPDNGHDCNWLGNQIDFIGNCELTVNEPKLVKLQFVSLFSFVFSNNYTFFYYRKSYHYFVVNTFNLTKIRT